MTEAPALAQFHPLIADWFRERLGEPTEIQRLAWPRILAGEHVLVTAPTGSGKTLTGFLAPLDRLLTDAWETGGLRVLYVSPLKALNADIERNLALPLAELTARFAAAGQQPPAIRVGVRSGDTPAGERQRQLRRPPEILITTPESLNLLLLSKAAPGLFAGLRLVILDEIHAVVASKRGTHLITAVERLTRFAGEFQRVAISATVNPVEPVARFVGGARLARAAGGAVRHERRPVAIVAARAGKRYDLRVRQPPGLGAGAGEMPRDEFWRAVAEDLRARIAEVRSTIVFTNSRRTAEKVTRFVNEAAGRDLAWSHHGSLAREIRTAVERRLKEGSLPAIVATSSLELGIDVGALERVVLLQTPRSLSSAAQRIGRAGHRAGEVSRAIFLPTHPRDFLDAAVAARAVREGDIEPLRAVRAPLDLLAQTLLALVATESWEVDALYDFVRTAEPYRELSRGQFDLVVEMLAGRYAEARVEELQPRVRLDRLAGTIAGRPGLVRRLAQGGGTIPDRGYFQLRLDESNAKLGELDEEFVWERSVGDGFVLGAQAWRIRAITANEVFVTPARGGALLAPFWRADARDRDAYFSCRIGELLERADARLDEPELARELEREHGFEPAAAEELLRLLREQRAALGVPLPHRHHLVFEETPERAGDRQRRQVVLYTFWGGTVNRPLAMALAALWEEREGEPLEALADDDAVLLVLPEGADPRALLAALDPERLEQLLRRRLESSGFFGALFRQNAQRALLLPRAAPNRRTPLWRSRQNAKRLLEAVSRFDDFPLLVETWRACLQDEFELDVLRDRLGELARGELAVSRARPERPSPFAVNLVWRRTNEQMYEDDTPEPRRGAALRGDLVREVALAAHDRPRIPRPLADRFRRTAQRLLPGYPPRDAAELLDWVKERFWIGSGEWRELLAAIDGERRGAVELPSAAEMVDEIAAELVELAPDGGEPALAARETALDVAAIPELAALFPERRGKGPITAGETAVEPLAAFLAQWLRFHPPLPVAEVARRFGIGAARVSAAVDLLVVEERAVRGALGAGGEADEVVARSSFETMLRWRRAAGRQAVRAVPLARLPALVAWQQGLIERDAGPEGLRRRLERLFGYPAAAGAWEREILPARLEPYRAAWLDSLLAETDLAWLGVGRERVTFALRGDLDLVGDAAGGGSASELADEDPLAGALLARLGAAPSGLELGELSAATGRSTAAVGAALWGLAWRGRVSHEAMRPLRQGVLSGFAPEDPAAASGASAGDPAVGARSTFRRWQATRALGGRWYLVPPRAAPADALGAEARDRERVRLLADRYGLLSRELLAGELPALSWARVVRSMRSLELAGELVGGHFVAGLGGLQFASPRFVAALAEGPPDGALWWHAATDPASLCGLDLPALKAELPRRQAGNWVVWRGDRIALVVRRGGRELDFRLSAADPDLPALMAPLAMTMTREFDPVRSIDVETIGGEPAARSAYRSAFERFAVSATAGGVRLRRRLAPAR